MQEIVGQRNQWLVSLVSRVMREDAVAVTLEDLLTDDRGIFSVAGMSSLLEFIEKFGMELFPSASEGSFDTQRLMRRCLSADLLRDQVRAIIAKGEVTQVEFKSSLRHDYKLAALHPGLELSTKNGSKIRDQVMKAICAFYNTDGGQILVGVSDDKRVLGLEPDYPLVRRSNSVSGDMDAWLQRFNQDLIDCFEDPGAVKRCVHAEPVEVDCKTIVRIQVGRGQSLGFITLYDSKCGHPEAFVREFVTSRALRPSDIEGHVLARSMIRDDRNTNSGRILEISAA